MYEQLLKAFFEGVVHAFRGRSTAFTIDEYVDKLANRFDFLHPLLEETNLVGDTAFPKLVDSKGKFSDSWKSY